MWGRDLTAYDPDGPLPDIEPDVGGLETISQGRVRDASDPREVAARWRALAGAEQLSIRQLVIRVGTRTALVGTPEQVADAIQFRVDTEAADGYILVPHLTPHGLDEFVDRVVPILQERGRFRADYEGPTLRDHLGLRRPVPARAAGAANIGG